MNETLTQLMIQRETLVHRIQSNSQDGRDTDSIYVCQALEATDELIEKLFKVKELE